MKAQCRVKGLYLQPRGFAMPTGKRKRPLQSCKREEAIEATKPRRALFLHRCTKLPRRKQAELMARRFGAPPGERDDRCGGGKACACSFRV
jgi:hypothetical protein